jgi:cytochrome oxidase Cu insertion factor (SCO1/SenC/PrrC family)
LNSAQSKKLSENKKLEGESMNSLNYKMRIAVPICLLISLFLLISSASAQYKVGDVVNDFTLGDLEDQPVSLYDFSGKAILLNFFATW